MEPWYLTLCVFVPTGVAVLLLAVPSSAPAGLFRGAALAACAASLVLSLLITAEVARRSPSTVDPIPPALAKTPLGALARQSGTARLARYPLEQSLPWIPTVHIRYTLAADGLSAPLVVMTAAVAFLAMLASWSVQHGVKAYCVLFLLLTTGMLGCFLALDFFLFYVFFEMMLVPMYFLIGLWGGANRRYAAMKFFLYTLVGSVLILGAMLAAYFQSPNPEAGFDLRLLPSVAAEWPRSFQTALFLLLVIGFAVKLPVFPFHTWLPDAHVEAPTPVSMVLAGVLLKLGGYGLYRIAWPLAPDVAGSPEAVSAVMLLGAVNIVYGAAVALGQTDFKRLVAYSSVSHMGFVLLGLASLTPAGLAGGLFQMVAHGVYSPAMFLAVGVLYDRSGHRDLSRFGGVAATAPTLAHLSIIAFLAAMAVPGLCGFPGELLCLLGAFSTRPITAAVCLLGLVLTAAYVLWAIQRVYLGPVPGAAEPEPHGHAVGGAESPPSVVEPTRPVVVVPSAEPEWWNLAGLAAFAAAAVVLGVLPFLLTDLFGLRVADLINAVLPAGAASTNGRGANL